MGLRSALEPLIAAIPADRQGARRHYGVHPYFTRRPYNVVRDYILHYSEPGDKVLDPFGGSGVTAIEAFLENRVGIQNDINPLANFIAGGIAGLVAGEVSDYRTALRELGEKCKPMIAAIQRGAGADFADIQLNVRLPENVQLPKTSDVDHYHDLFSRTQLLSLAVIKDQIDKLTNIAVRNGMLLAWSASLSKLNKTFLSAEGRAESRGGSSIFSIYRYKIAKKPVELPPWETFEERAINVIDAKAEMDRIVEFKRRSIGWKGKFECYAEDVSELEAKFKGKIDYIFTDPPYGGHISYLDLSTLWNVWLDRRPTRSAQESEIIVGGELGHSDFLYTSRLRDSVRSCVAMLKQHGWLSIVFQHWKVAYFEAILDGAAEAGAELRAAVSQIGDPIWSMHKKKGNQSVLAGELILTFEKTGASASRQAHTAFDIEAAVADLLSHSSSVVYGEELFNQLVIAAWQAGSIRALSLSKDDFIDMVTRLGWHYDQQHHYWTNGIVPSEGGRLWK